MSFKEIKYRYATDELGNLVDVNTISDKNKNEHTYQCLCCKEQLTPAIGKHNLAHFRHKRGSICNFETYLHQLGKACFKKRFLESDDLYINVKIKEYCNLFNTCKINIHKETDCQRQSEIPINLKKIFDTINIEKGYKGFVADILLEDSKGKVQPLMIEIYVTHACDQKKINSGIPIHEIPISSENDAKQIIESKIVYGSNYNFKEIKKASTQPLKIEIPIEEFIIYPSGKYFCSTLIKKCTSGQSFPQNVLFYCIATTQLPIGQDGFLKIARKEGFNLKSCNFCKFYKEAYTDPYNICTLYKKFKTPHHPDNLCAYGCPYYKENIDPSEIINNYQVIVAKKADFTNKEKQLQGIFKSKDLNSPIDRKLELIIKEEQEREKKQKIKDIINKYKWDLTNYMEQMISEKTEALNFFYKLLGEYDLALVPSFCIPQKYYSSKAIYDQYEPYNKEGKFYLKLHSSQTSKTLYIVFVTIFEEEQVKITRSDTPVIFVILNTPGCWKDVEYHVEQKIVVLREVCDLFGYTIRFTNKKALLMHYRT